MLKNLTQTLNTEYERTVFNTNTQFFYCVASKIESNKYKYLSHVATNSHILAVRITTYQYYSN